MLDALIASATPAPSCCPRFYRGKLAELCRRGIGANFLRVRGKLPG